MGRRILIEKKIKEMHKRSCIKVVKVIVIAILVFLC